MILADNATTFKAANFVVAMPEAQNGALQAVIDAMPDEGDMFATPEVMGELDGGDREPCCPEMYFVRLTDKIAYCNGYISANPYNEVARLTLALFEAQQAQQVEAIETEEYEEDMLDRAFWAGGRW